MKRKNKWISAIAGVVCAAMLLSLTGWLRPEQARAASSSALKEQLNDLEAENDELESKLEGLRSQLSDNLSEISEMVTQKDLLDQEIQLLYEQMENLNTQISAYSLLIAEKQEELDEAQAKLSQLQVKNKARIRAMEENGELSYWAVLFQANSFTEMLDRLEMIQEIAKADKKCLQEMDEAAKEVAAVKESMAAEQESLQEKRSQMDETETQLEEKRAQTDELLIQLKAQGDAYTAMIEESEALQEDLMQEIAAKRDEYEDAKYLEWLATSKTTTSGGSGGTVGSTGSTTWLIPCSYYYVSSPFGYRYHPIDGVWRMHNGVDLPGNEGTPIYASRSGYVTVAAYQYGGAGNYVALSHGDGYGSIYMHMTHYIVSAGQYVEAGQVIGYMGTTGGSTGVHLHFGISYNGVYVNPADYLNL